MADPQKPVSYDDTGQAVQAPPAAPPTGRVYDDSGTDVTPPPTSLQLAGSAARGFGSMINPLSMLSGLYEGAKEHPAIAATFGPLGPAVYEGAKTQYQKAKDAYDQGHYSEAAGHTLAMFLPIVGPAAADIGEQLGTGDPMTMAHGAGQFAGLLAAPKVTEAGINAGSSMVSGTKAILRARAVASSPAPALASFADHVKAIPPTNSAPYTMADWQRSLPYLADEHANSPVTDIKGHIGAINSAITQIEDHVSDYVNANPNYVVHSQAIPAAGRVLTADAEAMGSRGTDVMKGLQELNDLGLDKPQTLAQLDAIRLRLNAENQAVLARSGSKVATEANSDPAFAARQAAVETIRNEIYDTLKAQGIQGVDQLRLDEGSLIKIRNAAYAKQFAGDQAVGGTGATGILAKTANKTIPTLSATAGAVIGGKIAGETGAITGGGLGLSAGQVIASKVVPGNMTRNDLISRAYNALPLAKPVYPTIPPPSPVRGLLSPPATPLGGTIGTPTPGITPTELRPGLLDVSGVKGVPAVPPAITRALGLKALPPVTRIGEQTVRPMGGTIGTPVEGIGTQPLDIDVQGTPLTMQDASGVKAVPAKSYVIKDPETGHWVRVFVGQPNPFPVSKGGGS